MINELSQLMDVQAAERRTASVTLSTTAGLTLFNGSQPVKLTFDGRTNLAPQSRLLHGSGAAHRRHDHGGQRRAASAPTSSRTA